MVFELSKGLAARGHNVHVLTRRVDKSFPVHERLTGIHIHRYKSSGHRWLVRNLLAMFSIPKLFRELCSTVDFDIIHYHDAFAALGINLAATGNGIPKIATNYSLGFLETAIENPSEMKKSAIHRFAHQVLVKGYSQIIRGIESWDLRQAARIIVLSEFSKTHLKEFLGFKDEDVIVIPGGVDLEKFHPAGQDRSALKEALGIGADRSFLFTVRRLVHRMGLDNLIQAMVEVRKYQPQVLLVIAGEGHLRGNLQYLVKKLDLEENVKLIGSLADERLSAYYQAADLFILPTLALEGFGLIILEALACGCPVLGTPVGNIPDLLAPLFPDFVFANTNPEAMATRIIEMLAYRDKLESLRQTCAQYAQTFSWGRVADLTEELYLDIISAAC